MPLELVVFDLDGTLVDSVQDLALATNDAMALTAPEAPPIPQDAVRSFVGDGAQKLIARAIAHARVALCVNDVLPVFLNCYAKRLLDTTRAYDGIPEALDALAHLKLAVLTNKPGYLSRALLDGLGLGSRFVRIVGPDDARSRKPDPEGLVALMADLGASPSETVMVGDSANDVLVGRAASTHTVGVLWGLRPDDVRASAPDLTIEAPAQLAPALLSMLARPC
jgi:phosphoglycolate phosphatase